MNSLRQVAGSLLFAALVAGCSTAGRSSAGARRPMDVLQGIEALDDPASAAGFEHLLPPWGERLREWQDAAGRIVDETSGGGHEAAHAQARVVLAALRGMEEPKNTLVRRLGRTALVVEERRLAGLAP